MNMAERLIPSGTSLKRSASFFMLVDFYGIQEVGA
jgi:hypothetical protein